MKNLKRKLTKRNMRKFCEYLHDGEEYVPLICGDIAREKGGITTCCALGEMYAYFIDKPLFIDIGWPFTGDHMVSIGSHAVIGALIGAAGVCFDTEDKLEEALDGHVIRANDDAKLSERRTLAVVEAIEKHVIPLLSTR